MGAIPAITGRDEFHALVVRTDYKDDRAWQEVVAALMKPWGDGQYEAQVHVIDDRAWAEASTDDVLAAVRTDEYLSVVFLADRMTMEIGSHALLAVTTASREEFEEEEDYEALIEFGHEFRTVPAGVHDVHANLNIGNMGFEEYAEEAKKDPEGTYRSF
ncbi:DUF6924 domain-containing protein [Streptomyces vietnamensis]|uniref:DUF6924 domain-containing protein n=1 Tax=Streptomyces vietnamensis TaxID=362257 RepID=UPI0037B48EDF